MSEQVREQPRAGTPVGANGGHPPGANGAGAAPASATGAPSGAAVSGAPAQPQPRKRRSAVRRIVLLAVLLAVLLGGGTFGYRWYVESVRYVSTENAQVSGRLVQVGPLAAGRVGWVGYDVGQRVARDQVVARVYAPVPVGTTVNGQPRLEFRQTDDALIEVTAPVDGVVVARAANPGDTVPAGQPLLTLVDPRRLWINANVEETQIRRVQSGQPVEVHVDALGVDLPGRVAAVTPASASTFSLLPQQSLSGNFTKQVQLVPVKIELDQPEPRLTIGTSVSVRVRVAD